MSTYTDALERFQKALGNAGDWVEGNKDYDPKVAAGLPATEGPGGVNWRFGGRPSPTGSMGMRAPGWAGVGAAVMAGLVDAKRRGKEVSNPTNTEAVNPKMLSLYKPENPRKYTKEDMERVADDAIRQYSSATQERSQGTGNSGGSKGGGNNVDHWKDRINYLTEKLGLSRPAKGEAGKDFYEMIKGGDRTYSPYVNGEGTESVATKFGSAAAVNLFNSLMGETGKEIPEVIKSVGYAENQLAEADTNKQLLPGRLDTQRRMNEALPTQKAAGLDFAEDRPKVIDIPRPGNVSTKERASIPGTGNAQEDYSLTKEWLKKKKRETMGY